MPHSLNAKKYGAVYRRAAKNGGTPIPPAFKPKVNPWGTVTRTHWIDAIFRVAPYNKLNVQLSGMANKLSYMTSVGYINQKGILRATGYSRVNWRIKTQYNVTDRLTLGENVNISHIGYNGVNTSSSYSGAIMNAIYMNPAAPVYGKKTKYSGTVPFRLSEFAGAYGDVYNPVALLERPDSHRNNLSLNAHVFGKFDILKNLTFESNFSINLQRRSSKEFDHSRPEIGRSTTTTRLTLGEVREVHWVWQQKLNFVKDFGKNRIELTGIYSANSHKYRSFGVQFRDFSKEADYYQYISNAGDHSWPGTSLAWKDVLVSMVGVAKYNYDQKYYLRATLRRDVSSKLPIDNRTDYFPSLSGAWIISSEDFFNLDAVSLLKLRASWGKIGNVRSVGHYAFTAPLSSELSLIGSPVRRPIAIYQARPYNPRLQWEVTETYDIGLDIRLFNNKISFTTDVYKKYTRGVILQNLPNTTKGYEEGPFINAGDVLNKGIEFSLSYRGGNGDNFHYTLSANYSYNKMN